MNIDKKHVMPNIQKIRNHIEDSSKVRRDIKLFCAVYTYSGNVHLTDAISETWGQRCDGMLYASDHSNYSNGHMHLPSNSKYGFKYSSVYQRVRSMMAYLYDNFLDDYDFFHFCGDDVYMIVENMKEFLASDKIRQWDETPGKVSITGFWTFWNIMDGEANNGKFYLNGGPGYTLSRKALKAYVEGPLQSCERIDPVDNGMEDIQFSKCLWMHNFTEMNAFPDTRDEVGAHRYHSMNITAHSLSRPKEQGLYMKKVIPMTLTYLEEVFGFPDVDGAAYISNSSVVFHKHKSAAGLRRMEMLLCRDMQKECADIKV